AHPIDAGHVLGVELDLLPQRAAHALHDVALDGVPDPDRVDDLPAVVGDGEFARPDLAARTIDVDFGDHSAARAVALRIGDAAPADLGAGLVLARRRPRLPGGLFRRCLDHRDIARILDVSQAELDRVERQRRRNFVDEGLAREVHLRPDGIAQMRAAQRRGAREQGGNRFPRQALVGELVGFRRYAEAVRGHELGVEKGSGAGVLGRPAVGVYVDAGEALAGELVGDDVAGGIDGGAGAVDGGRALRVPPRRLLAGVLA